MNNTRSASLKIIAGGIMAIALSSTALAQNYESYESPVRSEREKMLYGEQGGQYLKLPGQYNSAQPQVVEPQQQPVSNQPTAPEEGFTLPPAGVGKQVSLQDPAERIKSGEQIISGGTSEDERTMLESVQSEYDLKLMFAATSGGYLSGVGVSIVNSAGQIVGETTTEGPYLLAKLEAGTYKVNAVYSGTSHTTNVTVGSNGITKTYNIFFKGD
jgi:hypothetical protein